MNFPVPLIVDTTLAHAIELGCDTVMLKVDGFPVTINCAAHECNIITDWAGKVETVDRIQLIEPLDALLIGAKSRFAPTITIYDCWWMNGQDALQLSYRERYVLARMNLRRLDDRFTIIQACPITAARDLWQQVMRDPVSNKGLVFRRSKDPANAEVYVKRFYAESPEELT